jgi:hypothetical protein
MAKPPEAIRDLETKIFRYASKLKAPLRKTRAVKIDSPPVINQYVGLMSPINPLTRIFNLKPQQK